MSVGVFQDMLTLVASVVSRVMIGGAGESGTSIARAELILERSVAYP